MKLFIRVICWWLKVCVLVLVFLLPFCVVYDWFNPWPPAVRTFMEYSGQHRLCVGYGGGKEVEYSNGVTTEKSETQKAFILFPAVFTSPKMIFITESQDGKITKIESRFGFWFLFSTYAVCLWGTWHFWIRPRIKSSR